MRHSFGSLLSQGGVAPRTAQAAMRHSSIDLTMNVYTDPKLLDVHAALDSLPELTIDPVDENLKATGTDPQHAPRHAPKTGNGGKFVRIPDNSAPTANSDKKQQTPEKQSVFGGLSEWSRRESNPRPLHCEGV